MVKDLFAKVTLFFFCFSCLAFAPAQAATQQLTLWIHPYRSNSDLITRFSPLTDYLHKKTGYSIKIEVSESYKSHIERVGMNQFDLAYMGPAPYVTMSNKYGKKRILACLEVHGSPFFHGILIARRDSPLHHVRELSGKTFAFGDRNSTMSHIVPHYMLMEAGVELQDLEKYSFLGSHNNVALAVVGGYYDAGGVKEEIYYQYRDRGLKLLGKSLPVAEHLFVASDGLSGEVVHSLRQALLELKDKLILTAIKKSVTGMAPVGEEDYSSLRRIIHDHDIRQEE